MTDCSELERRLTTALGQVRALAMNFTTNTGVDTARAVEPEASCALWAQGFERPTNTTADDHDGCSVGSYIHGFRDFEQAAGAPDTQALLGTGWVSPEALVQAPAMRPGASGIDYTPLRGADQLPEVVLIEVSPTQLMTLGTAFPELTLTGKPQCQIVPLARQEREPVVSAGCAVSRARTGMDAALMVCAIPGEMLIDRIGAIEEAARTDRSAAALA